MTPTDTERLTRDGARVEIEVSRRPLPGAHARRVVRVTFMVDTGADITVLSTSIVDALGVARVGETLIAGVTDSDPVEVPLYRVRLALAGVPPIDVDACALAREDNDVQGLLGRDALAHFDFSYRGPRGSFTLDPG